MRWLRRLWHKSLTERRLDSELQFHVEQQAAEYIAAGLPHDEARRRASIEFGGVERFKEECREARWENRLDILARDFQFAFRGLLKDRRFACIAIFALALGIGASTAIFSIVDNALFEPFPYKDSRRLVVIRVHDRDSADREWRGAFFYPELREYMTQNPSLTPLSPTSRTTSSILQEMLLFVSEVITSPPARLLFLASLRT
jgi:hypothetical protein